MSLKPGLTLSFVLILIFWARRVHTGLINSKIKWTKEILVGENHHIRWSHEDPEFLVMEICAPVRGYVAVGFSPNLNATMPGSDIVMGCVDSKTGTPYIKDLHAAGNSPPVEDEVSNVELLWAEENEYGTTIRFKRPWNTCDAKHDFEITEDTVRLIWAVNEKDPMRDGVFRPTYHGPGPRSRGGRSLFLKVPTHLMEFPDDAKIADLNIHYWEPRMPNVRITGDSDTTYMCKIFKAPELKRGRKHQIVGFRPLIEEESLKYVHHMNFFECFVPSHLGSSKNVFEKYLDHPAEQCYTHAMPPEWGDFCVTVPFVWLVGSEGLMLPEHGGIPLGERHNGTTYFMLEVHYNNPELVEFEDSSGLRIFVTEETRENDFGTTTFHVRIGQLQVIPPKTVWRNMAFCTSECTDLSLPNEGVTVTHATLHAHVASRKMRIRHIRNGVELPPIAEDNHYDFNYQQSRILDPPRKVLKGDIIMMECDYDTSTPERDWVTYGGRSTLQEMCQGYITYYPRTQLSVCKTQYDFHNFFEALGVDRVVGEDALEKNRLPYRPRSNEMYNPRDDAYDPMNNGTDVGIFDFLHVTEPRYLGTVREYIDSLDWVENNGELTKAVWKQWWEGPHVAFCTGPANLRIPLKNYIVKHPEYLPYEKPTSICPLDQYKTNYFHRVFSIL